MNATITDAVRVADNAFTRSRWHIVVLGLVPLILLLAAMRDIDLELGGGPVAGQQRAFEPATRFRTVVLILDSAGKSEMFDPALMPFVSSLRSSTLSGRCEACAAKATFPCIKSIFEGREATMGTTLQDFSAFASSRTTWPSSLAALGLRLVVASDHTLNRLYPQAFVDSLNYENLHVPLLERDAFVYRKAREWLNDPTIDVLILHIIGTDKVSHEYPVRGPVYRAKYREVDDFVREIAGRLGPKDYLYAISDHGHNQLGGHTEDAAYLVRGPLFPRGVHEDLESEDMLFLLSLPYGLTLPTGYEGQIRMDLTLVPPDLRDRWFSLQAQSWNVPITKETAQRQLNDYIVTQRTKGQRADALERIWRCAPFWLAAALFLTSELHLKRRRSGKRQTLLLQIALFTIGLSLALMTITGGGWLIALAAVVRCVENFGLRKAAALWAVLALVSLSAFWIFPAGLSWIHRRADRPFGFIAFYGAAFLCGLAIVRMRDASSWRARLLDLLWMVGIAVWLLGYFGPLGYSLVRHGSLMILVIGAIAAIIIGGGFRTFFSLPALFLPGLLPVVFFNIESFNFSFPLLDRIPELSAPLRVVLSGAAAALFVIATNSVRRFEWNFRSSARHFAMLLLVLIWLAMGLLFFQFELSKMIGCLLACLWFAGCLELFTRAGLPLRWFSLVSAVFLFFLLTFFLNGFVLSHVDFRFATSKIFPFAKEAYRAPQLILWSMLKYGFALWPALFVLRASSAGQRIWPELLVLGWWRELMIVAGALGLALFNARGMRESCSEEIYFWTFLNIVFFTACLIFSARSNAKRLH